MRAIGRGLWMLKAAAFIVAVSSSGCGACGDPNGLAVEGDPPNVEFSWEDSNAMGFYVTHRDAVIPDGPGKKAEGVVYWIIEATSFPGGFHSPVTYGELPRGAKDETEAHGGPAETPELLCGVEYKITVVALRGTDETFVEWDCAPDEDD